MEKVKEKMQQKVEKLNAETGEILAAEPSLADIRKRIALLDSFVSEILKEGTDYGLLPNTEKRCLFKSGAEKLCDAFGFAKRIEIINRTEDRQAGFFQYEIKAVLVNKATGMIEAEGIGSCNSLENKYKKQDPFNIANTLLKMAKKRAFIDATLTATRSSDLFTQDMEDSAADGKKPSKREAPAPRQDKRTGSITPASKRQISYIFSLLSEKAIPVETARTEMEQRYGVNETRLLDMEQAGDFIAYLKSFRIGAPPIALSN